MSDEPPRPPAEMPPDIIDTLNGCDSEVLRVISEYAEELAEYREREARLDEDGDNSEDRPDDLPSEVPTKATITIKEINNNRYYYWQWRDGDKIRSKYKGPVNPDE